MLLQEYIDLMHNESPEIDAKTKLWQAVYNGDYNKFLTYFETLSNINEYKFGITLLHALVLNDRCQDYYDKRETHKNRVKIAQDLLTLGANLHAPAMEGAPWPIYPGQTPWQMADSFDHFPLSHYPYGILASFAFSAERVLPVFKKHLGIQEHGMLFQFRRLCTKNPEITLAFISGLMLTAAYRAGYLNVPRIKSAL